MALSALQEQAPSPLRRPTMAEIQAQVEKTMAKNKRLFGGFSMKMLTVDDLITKKRAALQPLLAKRKTHTDLVATIRSKCDDETRDPSPDEAEQIRAARAAVVTLDEERKPLEKEIEELEAEKRADEAADAAARDTKRSGAPDDQRTDRAPVHVTGEERTYSPEKSARGESSFFIDAYSAKEGNGLARERLERNLKEAQVEGEISERATSTSSFAGLVVPQYLVELAARAIRSGRPVASAVTKLPLPSQGMSLIIPRGTTGASEASQATENSALSSTDEVWANLTVPVVTIGGQQDVSRQSLERGTPGIDEIVYLDLAGAFMAELDRQVVNGSGASGQMLGILQTAGINAATAYGAALSPANVSLKVAGQVAAIAGIGAGIQPRIIFMHPRRWGWLLGQVDGQGRPIVVPSAQGPYNAMGVNMNPGAYGGDGDPIGEQTTIVGTFQGLPVTTDSNVPTTVGTNSEDLIGVMDPMHALLWEDGDGMPKQLRFEQTLGNQLTVKLVAYGYAAFTAGRYPGAFGKTGGLDATGGNGQIAPVF